MGCRHWLGCVFLLLCLSADRAAGGGRKAECWLKGGGQVTNFRGQRYPVLIPCKFRLVHMACGDYVVKVTPGQGVDEDHLFYPDSVWVGITRKAGVKRVWKGRTSMQRLQKARSVEEVWQEKEANLTLDVETFSRSSQTAVLEVSGVLGISYSVQGRERTLLVSCSAPSFRNKAYPESLCGDESDTQGLIESRRQEILAKDSSKHNTKENMIIYDVLNNDKVRQRPICENSAATFQLCGADTKHLVARTCGSIFSDPDLSRCLVSGQDLVSNLERCLSAVCRESSCACRKLRERVGSCRAGQLGQLTFGSLQCWSRL